MAAGDLGKAAVRPERCSLLVVDWRTLGEPAVHNRLTFGATRCIADVPTHGTDNDHVLPQSTP